MNTYISDGYFDISFNFKNTKTACGQATHADIAMIGNLQIPVSEAGKDFNISMKRKLYYCSSWDEGTTKTFTYICRIEPVE
jgi:hypothetical protein